MIYLHALETIAILLISSLGPGLFFIRYLRWRPLETLCSSVALSLLLLYLAALAIYGLELSPTWAYAPTALAVLATLVCVGDLRRLWRHREARSAMLAFFALFFWLLLLLLLVRNYSGAGWGGDWVEHYERAIFFSEHQPLDTKFLNHYVLPARPPMMNLLSAQLFWQASPSFEMFQIVFAYLNALVILPCSLLAPSLVAKTRNRAWLIAGFLALSPMFAQNGTYTWTKEFAAFYELTALGLYLSAWHRNDSGRLIAACACLSTGLLVHYSIAPFIIFLAGHYLIVLFRRRNHRWRELIASAAVSTAIFSTWLGWSLYAYGAKATFGSNTTVTASQQFSLSGNIVKIAENTFNTLVPFPLRASFESGDEISRRLPGKKLAYLRDWCFCIYQTSFPAMLGLGGLTLVVWQLANFYFHPPRDPWQHRYAFWFWFVGVVTFISIAVQGEYDYFGVAHICLQPMVLLGLTFAAVALPHVPRLLRGVALVGLLIDASLGILLHFHLLQNDFGIVPASNGRVTFRFHLEMGKSALNSSLAKYNHNLTFLGDHAVEVAGIIEPFVFLGVLGICIGLWLLAAHSARLKRTTSGSSIS
jgi:hypothetical protein